MGVFNTINFQCPKCDGLMYTQSKAVNGCSNYSSDEVPVAIAFDISGDKIWCDTCSDVYTVFMETASPRTIKCFVVKVQ